MAILAVFALSPSVAFAHWPISSPALKLSVAKLRVGGVDRIERRVERDDEDAGVARLLDGRHDRGRIARHQQDALGAGRDQLLDRRDLAVVVAVELAGVGLRRQAEFLGLGLEALLHLDEERIGVGLGDEADDRPVGVGRRARQRERDRPRRRRSQRCRKFLDTCIPPNGYTAAALFPGDCDRETLRASRRPAMRRRTHMGQNFQARVKDNYIRLNNS